MILLIPLFKVLLLTISLYKWAVIVMAILSWLLAFGVVNPGNAFVDGLNDLLIRITEPFLSRIRKLLPSMSGIDLSPVVLILVLIFVEEVLNMIFIKYIAGEVLNGRMLN